MRNTLRNCGLLLRPGGLLLVNESLQTNAFLQARAGRCSSQQLVAHFKADCSNPALFKEVLKQVATKDAAGVWVLKGGFEPAVET